MEYRYSTEGWHPGLQGLPARVLQELRDGDALHVWIWHEDYLYE